MCKLQADEQKFIDELYDRHYNSLLKYAKLFLDPPTAEETVQGVFMCACSKIDEIITDNDPTDWLFRTLQFSVRGIIQSKKQLSQTAIHLARQTKSAQADFQIVKKFAIDGKPMKKIAEEEKITISDCNQKLSAYQRGVAENSRKNKAKKPKT